MYPQIHLHVLASGSKGNAALVEGPDGFVLVDCGITRKSLVDRSRELGLDLGRVRAVLLTHEHGDHTRGLPVFAKHFDSPMFATAGTVGARKDLCDLPFSIVGHADELDLAGMHVRLFPTSHDVCDPMCFRFETDDDALGYCTDTGVLTPEAADALFGVRILALESNHDERMLATGPYPAFLKSRVGGDHGHLSNAQAAEALRDLVDEDTETVVAMHLSQENNRPSVCIRTLAAAVGAEAVGDAWTEARTPDGLLSICAASQDWPATIW